MGSSDVSIDKTNDRLDILGVLLDPGTRSALLTRILRFLDDPWDGRCRQIVTLNPEYVMAARTSDRFRAAIAAADLVVADGVGVVIAGRIGSRSENPAERFTGVDLVGDLAETGRPLYLLGAGPGVAEEAAHRLATARPATTIAGYSAEFTADERDDARSLEAIGDSGAQVVAVAYGAPQQVLWIERNQAALAERGVRLAVGVGGALDYIAGARSLPPKIVRDIGLEWLYRLVREPWRWRRQLVLPRFAALVLIKWARSLMRKGDRVGRS